MNFNDAVDRALTQAREVQRRIAEAASGALEQVKPQVQKSLDDARDLQSTLTRHAEATSATAQEQTTATLGHLTDFIRMGTEAMRESAEQTRETALKMVDQSKKIVDAARGAGGTEPPDRAAKA